MATHRDQHISTRPFFVLSKLLGTLMIVAGALKAYALLFDPLSQDGILRDPWMQVLAIECEVFLGMWLLVGYNPRLLWRISLMVFVFFSAVSFYLGITGQASCGCFGQVRVSPWISLVVDLAAVIALLVARPLASPYVSKETESSAPREYVQTAIQLFCLVALMVAGILIIAHLWSENPSQTLAKLRQETLRIDPSVVDVGKNLAGTSMKMAILLRNEGKEAIQVYGGSVTCVCMAFHDLPVVVPPGDAATVHISIVFKGTPGRFTHGFKLFHSGKEEVTAGRFTGVVAAR